MSVIMGDYEQRGHVEISAENLRSGMFIDMLTLGRCEITSVIVGLYWVHAWYVPAGSKTPLGDTRIVRYKRDSLVEVVASDDGF